MPRRRKTSIIGARATVALPHHDGAALDEKLRLLRAIGPTTVTFDYRYSCSSCGATLETVELTRFPDCCTAAQREFAAGLDDDALRAAIEQALGNEIVSGEYAAFIAELRAEPTPEES
ncbi:MAG TPA: hypothetical protein VMW48_12570 [Vicinamibacterales bacterium]|nr:hypothetical protein [Vicinamibacterales bacterium]